MPMVQLGQSCPLCASMGRLGQICQQQVNFEEAVLLCDNQLCVYPMGIVPVSDYTITCHVTDEALVTSAAEPMDCKNSRDWSSTANVPPLASNESFNIPNSEPKTRANRKTVFLQWRNNNALCWLDVLLTLLVHCSWLRRVAGQPKVNIPQNIKMVLSAYDQALSFMTRDKPIKDMKNILPSGGGTALQELTPTPSAGENPVLRKFFDSLDVYGLSGQNNVNTKILKKPELNSVLDYDSHLLPHLALSLPNSPPVTLIDKPEALVKLKKHLREAAAHYHSLDVRNYYKAEKVLNTVRQEVWNCLEPLMHCELGKNDSPLIALFVLLHTWSQESVEISRLFNLQGRWQMTCTQCLQNNSMCISDKAIVTFPSVREDFSVNNAYFVRTCASCTASNQQYRLLIDTMPQCLMLHFMSGLPSCDMDRYLFKRDAQTWSVRAIVRYRNKPTDHFIAYVRDGQSKLWMECDDLKSPLCCHTMRRLHIPPSEIHLVLWEKEAEEPVVPVRRERPDSRPQRQNSLSESRPPLSQFLLRPPSPLPAVSFPPSYSSIATTPLQSPVAISTPTNSLLMPIPSPVRINAATSSPFVSLSVENTTAKTSTTLFAAPTNTGNQIETPTSIMDQSSYDTASRLQASNTMDSSEMQSSAMDTFPSKAINSSVVSAEMDSSVLPITTDTSLVPPTLNTSLIDGDCSISRILDESSSLLGDPLIDLDSSACDATMIENCDDLFEMLTATMEDFDSQPPSSSVSPREYRPEPMIPVNITQPVTSDSSKTTLGQCSSSASNPPSHSRKRDTTTGSDSRSHFRTQTPTNSDSGESGRISRRSKRETIASKGMSLKSQAQSLRSKILATSSVDFVWRRLTQENKERSNAKTSLKALAQHKTVKNVQTKHQDRIKAYLDQLTLLKSESSSFEAFQPRSEKHKLPTNSRTDCSGSTIPVSIAPPQILTSNSASFSTRVPSPINVVDKPPVKVDGRATPDDIRSVKSASSVFSFKSSKSSASGISVQSEPLTSIRGRRTARRKGREESEDVKTHSKTGRSIKRVSKLSGKLNIHELSSLPKDLAIEDNNEMNALSAKVDTKIPSLNVGFSEYSVGAQESTVTPVDDLSVTRSLCSSTNDLNDCSSNDQTSNIDLIEYTIPVKELESVTHSTIRKDSRRESTGFYPESDCMSNGAVENLNDSLDCMDKQKSILSMDTSQKDAENSEAESCASVSDIFSDSRSTVTDDLNIEPDNARVTSCRTEYVTSTKRKRKSQKSVGISAFCTREPEAKRAMAENTTCQRKTVTRSIRKKTTNPKQTSKKVQKKNNTKELASSLVSVSTEPRENLESPFESSRTRVIPTLNDTRSSIMDDSTDEPELTGPENLIVKNGIYQKISVGKKITSGKEIAKNVQNISSPKNITTGDDDHHLSSPQTIVMKGNDELLVLRKPTTVSSDVIFCSVSENDAPVTFAKRIPETHSTSNSSSVVVKPSTLNPTPSYLQSEPEYLPHPFPTCPASINLVESNTLPTSRERTQSQSLAIVLQDPARVQSVLSPVDVQIENSLDNILSTTHGQSFTTEYLPKAISSNGLGNIVTIPDSIPQPKLGIASPARKEVSNTDSIPEQRLRNIVSTLQQGCGNIMSTSQPGLSNFVAIPQKGVGNIGSSPQQSFYVQNASVLHQNATPTNCVYIQNMPYSVVLQPMPVGNVSHPNTLTPSQTMKEAVLVQSPQQPHVVAQNMTSPQHPHVVPQNIASYDRLNCYNRLPPSTAVPYSFTKPTGFTFASPVRVAAAPLRCPLQQIKSPPFFQQQNIRRIAVVSSHNTNVAQQPLVMNDLGNTFIQNSPSSSSKQSKLVFIPNTAFRNVAATAPVGNSKSKGSQELAINAPRRSHTKVKLSELGDILKNSKSKIMIVKIGEGNHDLSKLLKQNNVQFRNVDKS